MFLLTIIFLCLKSFETCATSEEEGGLCVVNWDRAKKRIEKDWKIVFAYVSEYSASNQYVDTN